MRRAQQQVLRTLLRSSGAQHEAAAWTLRPQPELFHRDYHIAGSLRACDSAQQQKEGSGRLEALAALTGGLAVYGVIQPTAEALVAEPQPGSDPQNQASASPEPTAAGPAPDLYAFPQQTKGVPREVILYQYDVCPFCCKVKAVLDFYRIPYRCVEVGPLMKAELKWSPYKKVPVALLDGEVVTDSSAIISRIAAEKDAEEAAQAPPPKRGWFGRSSPSAASEAQPQHTGKSRGRVEPIGEGVSRFCTLSPVTEEELRWRRWVDQRLVRVLTVNIYRNRRESFQTFDYITQQGNFNWLEAEAGRVIGAATMWMVSGRLRKKYGIEGDAREELYGCAEQWTGAVGAHPFLGGHRPNLADLSVFGAVRSITGTDTFMDLMHNGGKPFSEWYERMMAAVGNSCRIPE